MSASDAPTESGDCDWISWFCHLKGNEFFCPVEVAFVADAFNLTGLSAQIEDYELALDIILDEDVDDSIPAAEQDAIESAAENLYGLIHARFILTTRGLAVMHEKYKRSEFGRCSRVACRGAALLPVGLSDTTQHDCVKLYCPCCEEVYAPRASRHHHIDGAYFGTTFPHLFFLTYPELKPTPAARGEPYQPRVFGFKLHKEAYTLSLQAKQAAALAANGGPAVPPTQPLPAPGGEAGRA